MNGWAYAAILAAAVLGGAVNAVAGGGTLVVFPVLIALRMPAVLASATVTVGMVTGYLGSSAGYREQVRLRRALLRTLSPPAAAGALAGAALLLLGGTGAFRAVAPVLVLAACALLVAQPRLTRRLGLRHRAARPEQPGRSRVAVSAGPAAVVGVAVIAVYGGYFGAALGVMLLAWLGLTVPGPWHELNAVKGVLSLVTNSAAALVFVATGRVAVLAALAIAVGAPVGGRAGVAGALRVPPRALRALVLAVGLGGAALLLRG